MDDEKEQGQPESKSNGEEAVAAASSPSTEESTVDLKVAEDAKSSKSRGSTGSEICCRICFDANEEEAVVTLCLCRGSIGKVHKSCLERWLATNNTHCCELCGYRFNTTRSPKYKPVYSVYYWMFKEKGLESRSKLWADVTFMAILSPVVCLAIYSSVAVSSYYSQPSMIMNAATSWIAISMTMVSTVLSIGFYLWLSQTLHHHGESWYRWWQCKNQVIILSPPPPPHRLLLETCL